MDSFSSITRGIITHVAIDEIYDEPMDGLDLIKLVYGNVYTLLCCYTKETETTIYRLVSESVEPFIFDKNLLNSYPF